MESFRPLTVVNIDLRKGFPALACPDGRGGLYAFLWWDHWPLGHVLVPAGRLPMDAGQVREMALTAVMPTLEGLTLGADKFSNAGNDAIAALAGPLEAMSRGPTGDHAACLTAEQVSVVVCTRDRPDHLRGCLEALDRLSPMPGEIVVVDNAPTSDATRKVVADWPRCRYVLEPKPGLSPARNTGIRHSRGEILVFTDDDAKVVPAWIDHLLAGFIDPSIMVVTGLTLPMELETEAQYVFETDWTFNRGYLPRTFDHAFLEEGLPWGPPVWDIGGGGNMACRRQIFDLVGGFDDRLGAGAAGCSEDTEFFYRVLARGWSCRYQPSAVMWHQHRRDMEGLNQQVYSYMRGHCAALLVQFETFRHWGNLRRLLVVLPSWFLRLAIRNLLGRDKNKGLKVLPQVLGSLAGIAYYARNRHSPKAE